LIELDAACENLRRRHHLVQSAGASKSGVRES
jgi:hypothetical protein